MSNELPCPKIGRRQGRLTPEQEAYARQFVVECTAAVLSTGDIDEPLAEEHLRNAYRVAGLEPPAVKWFDSSGDFQWALMDDIVRDEQGVRSRHSMGEDMRPTLCSHMIKRVKASIEEKLWNYVEGYVGHHGVMVSVWDRLRNNIWEIFSGGRGSDHVQDNVMAYYEAGWVATARFFHETFEPNDLIHFARLNEMVSGYLLGSKEAWLIRKPIRLERDEQGRLHCANGPCWQYRDGWDFYAWHGVRVPAEVILQPEQLTKDDWLKETNVEVRRVIQERMPDFVEQIGARFLNGGERGCLYEVDLGNDPEKVAHYVQVADPSTERWYYLRVPPTITSADEAVAWTFGLSEQAYQPEQET